MITKCKACNADIMFVTTVLGRKHPVNLPAVKMWVRDPDENFYSFSDCHTSHFATCPNADQFRKKEQHEP